MYVCNDDYSRSCYRFEYLNFVVFCCFYILNKFIKFNNLIKKVINLIKCLKNLSNKRKYDTNRRK